MSMSSLALILGWLGLGLSTLLAAFWAFWGAIESLHEGWYEPTLGTRLIGVLRYLTPAIVLITLSSIAITWPWLGSGLLIGLGLLIWLLIRLDRARVGPAVAAMLAAGPVILGGLYIFGKPAPHWLAQLIVVVLPLLVMIASGAVPAYRIATRIDDGDRGPRLVFGQRVTLLWAPAGPGWERQGSVSWDEARRRCRYLAEDGHQLAAEPLDLWRLPAVDEAVRSMLRHGDSCGGVWDAEQGRARYAILPDKESPLWDTRSPVIYWWTAGEADQDHALFIAYNGHVGTRAKSSSSTSLGFRAVRADEEAGSHEL